MARLAIKGHAIRGREVIEILEMLGGDNKYHINITECDLLYTIREGDDVIIGTYPNSSISQIYTLEEFLEKFPYKVGDRVKRKDVNYTHIVTIAEIDGEYYGCVNEDGQYSNIFIESQDKWELVPDKFDITTLIPFESRVLVRDFNDEEWCPAIWGVYGYGKEYPYIVVSGNNFIQCIPYEKNEHLLGTTNDCDDYYKTWK